MFHYKQKLKCHEKETITVQSEQEKSPKNDIELCLEVEMDDEVRDIITSPGRCLSTLLDVTVIKPDVDVDQVYTQRKTLNGDEVRKLITVMELEKQGKQKLINQILSKDGSKVTTPGQSNNPKSAGDYVKPRQIESTNTEKKSEVPTRFKRFQYMDGHDSQVFFQQLRKHGSTDETTDDDGKQNVCIQSMRSGPRVQQIYTTPRTYNDIKSIFTCKNKQRYENDEKPNKPCMCQNCAIVGVLTDSQKRPFITENLYDPREYIFGKKDGKETKTKRKKSVNFRDDTHIECHYYFKHLSAKIKDLEERLVMQEERSVPRDYFKRIITKLVAHISKITSYGSQEKFSSQKYRDYRDYKEMHKHKEAIYGSYGNKYHVHAAVIDPKSGKVPAEKEFSRVEADLLTASCFVSSNQPQQSHAGHTSQPQKAYADPINHPQQPYAGSANKPQQTYPGPANQTQQYYASLANQPQQFHAGPANHLQQQQSPAGPANMPQQSHTVPANMPQHSHAGPANMPQQRNVGFPSQPHTPNDGLWKWGEEILRPGMDLKNKIMVLLEDTMNSLKKGKEQQSKPSDSVKPIIDVLSKALPKIVNETPVRDTSQKKSDSYEPSRHGRSSRQNNSTSNFSESKQKFKRLLPQIFSKGDFLDEEPINISYMNPTACKWQDESLISFKFDSCDIESLKKAEEKKLNDSYKKEFLDTLTNTKELDKLTLWQSIWHQAKINGQTKQDKVTIQIPDRKNMTSQRVIEIEYTIAELEKLLTGKVGRNRD